MQNKHAAESNGNGLFNVPRNLEIQLETAKISADIRVTILSLRAQQEEMQKIHEENVKATTKGVLACSFAHTMRCDSWPDST